MRPPRKSVSELTLRDYFAAAVAGAIWRELSPEYDTETCALAIAQKAYIVADEMMIERDKR